MEITLIESFLKAKGTLPSEDGTLFTPHFAAVADGATGKSQRRFSGKTTGRCAMEIALKCVSQFAGDISLEEAVREMSQEIMRFYIGHNMLDEATKHPEQRLAVSLAIYSLHYNEIWLIGDARALLDGRRYYNEKSVDRILSRKRAALIERYLKEGTTREQLQEHDLARDDIMPLLKRQCHLENDMSSPLGYTVINGFPIDLKGVIRIPVGTAQEFVLASDGYPEVLPTLQASERYLSRILAEDPLCFRLHPSTKGLMKGNVSFDDRAYLRVALRR